MLSKRQMRAIAVACDIKAIREVFPKGDEAKIKRGTYTLCFKSLMMDIAYALRLSSPGDTVLLIHDHGNWDANALAAYTS